MITFAVDKHSWAVHKYQIILYADRGDMERVSSLIATPSWRLNRRNVVVFGSFHSSIAGVVAGAVAKVVVVLIHA